jgi:hypothetical protein
VELAAGEKGRVVAVRLALPPPPPAPAPPEVKPAVPRSPVSYVLGAVGLAGLAVGAGLGIKGQVDKASLEGSCAPRCDRTMQVDPIAREWWAGAASAIAGGALLATGVVVWAVEGRSRPARVTLVPSLRGVIVAGRF